jgi:hypothetical protein
VKPDQAPTWQDGDGTREINAGGPAWRIHGNQAGCPVLKPVPAAPGYFADSAGIIWSSRSGKLIPLRAAKASSGYRLVTIYADGKKSTRSVHSLVLTAFVGPRPDGMVGCHNNGVCHDNRIENLRWDTQAGNLRDRVAHGTSYRGEGNPRSKLTAPQVREILQLRETGTSAGNIAERFGVTAQSVRSIFSGETWNHLQQANAA